MKSLKKNLSANCYVEALKKFREIEENPTSSVLTYLSSHPGLDQRIESAEQTPSSEACPSST